MNYGTGHLVGFSSLTSLCPPDIRAGDLPPPLDIGPGDLPTLSPVLLKICIHLCHIMRQHNFDSFSRHEVGIMATCDGIHTATATANKKTPQMYW